MVNSLKWKNVRFIFFLLVVLITLPIQTAFSEDHKIEGRSRGDRTSWNTDSERNSGTGEFGVTIVNWNAEDSKLYIEGFGAGKKKIVTIRDVGSGELIGSTRSEDDGTFKFAKSHIELSSCEIEIRRFDDTRIREMVCQDSDGDTGDNTSNDGNGTGDTTGNFTLLAWNDLGMHCMDGIDYSIFSILPPYNNLHAQLIRKQGTDQKLITQNVSITYEAAADADGAINTSSATPSNYWDFVALLYEPLFGPLLGVDFGLVGNPVQSETPAPMNYNNGFGWWEAEGIPTDPYDDDGAKNFYPLVKVVAKDLSGNILATTTTVLPVSDEMDCRACHASGSFDAAKPNAGWVSNPDSEKDYKLNILRLHDENHNIASYQNALAQMGYVYSAGLYETSLNGTPILCSSCHGSNALPGTGLEGIPPLTQAIHGFHAQVMDPTNHQRLDDIGNRSSCYRCHPGADTQCLRGAMGAAVNSDGTSMMSCQSCHGNMSNVGASERVGWLAEPNCQSCHFNGQRLMEVATSSPNNLSGTRFATNSDTPVVGTSLFRFSKGHGDLQCEACHGATHAIYPSAEPGDNIQSIAVQGHIGTIAECTTCHDTMPFTADHGPHGLHTVGQTWVNGHESIAEHGSAQCTACHGDNYQGSALSKTSMARVFQFEHGSVTFDAGLMVSCYDCHNGPGGGD